MYYISGSTVYTVLGNIQVQSFNSRSEAVELLNQLQGA